MIGLNVGGSKPPCLLLAISNRAVLLSPHLVLQCVCSCAGFCVFSLLVTDQAFISFYGILILEAAALPVVFHIARQVIAEPCSSSKAKFIHECQYQLKGALQSQFRNRQRFGRFVQTRMQSFNPQLSLTSTKVQSTLSFSAMPSPQVSLVILF